jgi:signal transduction histidine kinase
MKNRRRIPYIYQGRRIPYIYAASFLCLIALILIGISIFLIKRTSSTLIEIYWKQGELVVESIAISAQQTIESIKLSPQQIKKNLRKTATQIDDYDSVSGQIPIEILFKILDDNKLHSIRLIDQNKITTSSTSIEDKKKYATLKSSFDPGLIRSHKTFLYSYPRINKPGTIELRYTEDKLQDIKFSIGLQIFIASLENRNIIQYITFLNDRLRVIADSDPTQVGEIDEKQEYQDALESDASYFFLNNDIMEIIQPLSLNNNVRGVFKISFPTTEIDRIYRTTVKNTLIFSGWFMLLAIITSIVMLKFQQYYSRKLAFMEKRVQENKMLSSMANMAAGVAHEVRNPLNSISMIIQRLQLEFTPKNDEDVDEYMSFTALMKNEVDRINKIVTDFLGFSKPFDLKRSNFLISDFLNDTIKLFISEASKKGVKLELKDSAKKKMFFGDHDKLTQVFVNLIKNAIDAVNSNGIIAVNSTIEKKQKWLITIEDNGVGIPIKKLDHIFDIYFTTKQNGTGLGLYISRKIVLAHNGSIIFSESRFSGTKVSVQLPFGNEE